jgi:transcriptional regulator with XRE-family HTH domain
MNDFDLGTLIKDHRKAGLTQLELADLAGVGKTTVLILKNKETVRLNNLLQYLSAKY